MNTKGARPLLERGANALRWSGVMWFERTPRAAAIVLSVLAGVGPTLPAFAQTPTAAQLKAFQSLPQAQRDAILNQLTQGAAGAGTPPTPKEITAAAPRG